jgi:hypothetical protein
MTDSKDQLDVFLKRYKLAAQARANQARRENEDLQFQDPEKQWDEGAKRERLGFAVAGVPTPPRPCLSVSKVLQPINQILNQERAAHLGINIHPRSTDADKDTAEIIQGLYRSIETPHGKPNAQIARSWAFDRAVKCGLGWYRVGSEYDEASDDKNDQIIRIMRIYDQSTVYMDPLTVEPDYSDARWGFITAWVGIEEFEREWPDAEVTNSEGELALSEGLKTVPDWIRADGESKSLLVAEHWYYEYEGKNKKKRLYYCKMNGLEFLEGPPEPWDGDYIPLIPVIGQELQPFDGEKRYFGVIRPARDPQRMYNYAASAAVEKVALEPKAPWQADPKVIEGFESFYQQSNTRNLAVLPFHADIAGPGGNPLPPPQRVQVQQEAVGPAMALMQEANDWIQSTTAQFNPSLGRDEPRRQSGKAITALQGQGEQANSNFLYNLGDISLNREAQVVLNMMLYKYDRPGRIVQIMDAEDKTEAIMLNQEYFVHPTTEMPTEVPEQYAGSPHVQLQNGQTAEVQKFDLKQGVYAASVSIGKSFQTKSQEAFARLSEIIQAMPNLAPLLLPTLLQNDEFAGSRELADIMMKARDAQFPFLSKTGQGEQASPEQLQAQNQQLQQQLQQAHQQLQQAGMMIHTKQVEQQGRLQETQMKTASQERIATAKNANDLVLERMDEMTQLLKQVLQSRSEAAQGKHEAIQSLMDQGHEAAMGAAQSAHDQAMPAKQAAAQPIVPPFTASATQPISGEQPL